MRAFKADWLLLALAFAVLSLGCKKTEAPRPLAEPVAAALKIKRPSIAMDPVQARILKTNASEEAVLALAPQLRMLKNIFAGESPGSEQLFDSSVQYKGPVKFDLAEAIGSQATDQNKLVVHVSWPLDEKTTDVSNIAENIWSPLLDSFKFEDAQIGVLSGELLDDQDVFHMKTIFEGRFRDDQQRVFGVTAKQTLDWTPVGGNAAESGKWQISKWEQDSLEIAVSPEPLFENVTEAAIPSSNVRKILHDSQHVNRLIARGQDHEYLKQFSPAIQYFIDWNSLFQYTSVSVVDIDQDQWDDLFVLDRWGESVLLRNQGDGTFEDVSESCGLKLDEALANCALFADFDNDGDSDVLIGRSIESSLFYRNDGGKFVPDKYTNKVLESVKFVSSGSVVDVNGDGLLDVYLSTYCTRGGTQMEWIQHAVPPNEQARMKSLVENSHSFLDRRGPPNILLLNKGGKLKKIHIDDTLKQWRVSFQPVWSDIDNDGDPDLYLCNDFSPDVLLRNDTRRGSFSPKFTDITGEVFVGGSMGFGMGANFGDYNSDGTLDLYVSNMYSKAGRRIIDQMGAEEVDPNIVVSAQGNFLYKNVNGKFEQVAGPSGTDQKVAKVGWSFGGQMADFNNDSKLDIYVPSGFFTAPDSIASDVDL